jgi:single-strand DNA-binding protein
MKVRINNMNKVILMGRLTRDLEVKVTGSTNTTVLNGTIAVDRGYTKPGEERKADFINLVAFGKTAEFVNNYFTKGNRMVLNGRIQTRTWDDQDGKKRYATDIVAEEINFVDSKSSNGASSQSDSDNADEEGGFFPVESDDELPF